MSPSRWILGTALAVGFLLRFHAAFVAPHPDSNLASTTLGDQILYDDIGWNVASGQGFKVVVNGQIVPSAFITGPLYPLFLASIYVVVGHDVQAVRFVQCLLGVALIWILYELGKHLFSPAVGLLAAVFCAGYPAFIRLGRLEGPAFLMSENLFLPLFCLSILTLVHLTRRPTFFNQVTAGICLGLTTLCRATTLAFPVALLVWLMSLRRWSFLSSLRTAGWVTLAMGLVVAPWTWRNYQVFHRIVPVSTAGGINFWHGNNPFARGGCAIVAPPIPPGVSPQDEVTYEWLTYQAGLDALRKDFKRIPLLIVKKILVFWMPFTNTRTWQVHWAYLFAGPWALIGWWFTRREPFRWLPIIIPAVYLTFLAVVFFGDPRYRVPLEPLLLVLASAGVTTSFLRYHKRSCWSDTSYGSGLEPGRFPGSSPL